MSSLFNFELSQSRNTDRPLACFDFSGSLVDLMFSNLPSQELLIQRYYFLKFIELCTVFLDGELAGHSVTFKRPGAMYKARWMARLIYLIKNFLFQHQIQKLP